MSLKRGTKWRLVVILTVSPISNGDKLFNSIPKTWKKVLIKSQSASSNLVLLDHQLLKNNRTLSIEKIIFKEVYSVIGHIKQS